MSDNNTPLLTPEDIAQRLNIAVRTAYDYLSPGGCLYHLRIELGRRKIRVDPAELNQYIEQAKKGASDASS